MTVRWQTFVDQGKTPKSKNWRARCGLHHVLRFLRAVEHEDDCPCHHDSGMRGQQCECGKVLAVEQVRAAAAQLRDAQIRIDCQSPLGPQRLSADDEGCMCGPCSKRGRDPKSLDTPRRKRP